MMTKGSTDIISCTIPAWLVNARSVDKTKSRTPVCDVHDVTLGSSAILRTTARDPWLSVPVLRQVWLWWVSSFVSSRASLSLLLCLLYVWQINTFCARPMQVSIMSSCISTRVRVCAYLFPYHFSYLCKELVIAVRHSEEDVHLVYKKAEEFLRVFLGRTHFGLWDKCHRIRSFRKTRFSSLVSHWICLFHPKPHPSTRGKILSLCREWGYARLKIV